MSDIVNPFEEPKDPLKLDELFNESETNKELPLAEEVKEEVEDSELAQLSAKVEEARNGRDISSIPIIGAKKDPYWLAVERLQQHYHKVK